MAKVQVVMPQMGESITNGTITKWHKSVGDTIELDEILLEISTDKVESEIPSPFEGRIEELHFKEGDTIDVGITIASIEDDPSNASSTAVSSQKVEEVKVVSENKVSVASSLDVKKEKVEAVSTSAKNGERKFYTPLVKSMAEEAGVPLSELDQIAGSGTSGRVNKSDFLNYLETRKKGGADKSVSAKSSSVATASFTPPTFNHGERTERIPMDNMRKAISKNMVISKQISPHVNSVSQVDLTHLVKYRESFKNEFLKQEGFKLTYTPFIIRAIILALKDFPLVNSSLDGDDIIIKKDINLGCAVAVPGNGLIVPIIKQADTLNMTGLCRAINSLAHKARAKKLTMDELTGGTYTFSNVGSFGTLFATPIILQPQVGIYASGVIRKEVKVMPDDSLAIRSMMYGTHSYDHRLVDGELGGKFLESVHSHLVNMDPSKLF